MATRQLLGMAISLGGLLVVTRLLGPSEYGRYAIAFSITNYAFQLSQWGINIYLMRADNLQAEDSHQAFTLLLAVGLCEAVAAALLGGVAEHWIGVAGLATLITALGASVPLQLAILVPAARLERELRYKRLAACELAAQASLYAVAMPAAFAGWGVAAPVAGQWAQHLVMALSLFVASGYRPRLHFERARIRPMLRYGLGYSASVWVWQLRLLINPLVVAPVLGASAAGVINVATRLVEALGFIRTITWRIFIPLLGRLQSDRDQVAGAVGQGMRLQILAIGTLLLGFTIVAPMAVPLAFGRDWAPIVDIYPFLAAGFLFNCVFNLEASALYVLGRNWEVALYHLAHVALFATTAALFVPHLGLAGYGLGEITALAAYAIVHRYCVSAVGPIPIALSLIWASGFAGGLFTGLVGRWAWLALLLVLAVPETWRQVGRYWTNVKDMREMQNAR